MNVISFGRSKPQEHDLSWCKVYHVVAIISGIEIWIVKRRFELR